ncbi:MAG: DEAD/DEAH box helicase [Halioglobus sp.]|nr:DEAD/DEAH box helicase [Halioglobus sp.]
MVKTKKKRAPAREAPAPRLPPATDWRTSDADELAKRRLRAREERHRITNFEPEHPIFSNFEVLSPSGMTYRAEIRDLASRQLHCTCTDFAINGLGTCKHIEAIFLQLARRQRAAFKAAERTSSPRVDIVPDLASGRLLVERNVDKLPPRLRARFDSDGLQRNDATAEELFEVLGTSRSRFIRISQEVQPWLEMRAREQDRIISRRDYTTGVAAGTQPEQVTHSPLLPYQREGMLHLAFNERALLADEMGLGKTIQAIAACALLHHLGKAQRALIVAPASLKAEWEEQIQRFSDLSLRLVFGGRAQRAQLYAQPDPPFFTIANYEQILADSLDINARLRPDIVVLDEAQRIKNWSTKTAQAVKRLQSRYAFVLTGTPIENRIDELRSIIDFLDPAILGPLFRFNREYYELDSRGRPAGYKNLDKLAERVRPIMLRRRKADVETELADRTDRTHFVKLTRAMRDEYAGINKQVAELVARSKKRPLTPKEQDLLMVLLNMLRMICDSPGIMKDNPSRDCPKLDELARILDECLADGDVKVIVFSEWIGMLERVRAWADKRGIGYAWHTGSVPQKQRRAEILCFREDPECRLFLSTDSGGVGLNLQNASVVVNCDLPWNPAKLEQRIARAWRKNQLKPVTVVNLVAEGTIEHGMLASLSQKMELAAGVLDGAGDLGNMTLKSGRQALLQRLEQVMAVVPSPDTPVESPPTDPAAHFASRAKAALGGRLTECDETWIPGSATPVIVAVLQEGAERERVEALFDQTPWRGDKPTLQVLDAPTWRALEQLAGAGMISIRTRATRPLLPVAGQPARPPLSAEQLERSDSLRELAERKRRAARALLAEDLTEEAATLNRDAEAAEAEAAEILSC